MSVAATQSFSRELLQNIIAFNRSQPKRSTKSASASASSSSSNIPPTGPSSLSAPGDITASLIDQGLEFKLARAVSTTYLDKAVQLQLHSQSRLQSNQRRIARSRHIGSHKEIAALSGKLRSLHHKIYRSDLKVILKKTVSLAKARLQAAQASQQQLEDSAEDDARGSNDAYEDEDGAGDDGSVNADDERALQEMSARSSVLLSMIYERGHTFPRRYEKIKLAEETGLTYRQIGIWFSNRRERNRPGRERGTRGDSTPSNPSNSARPTTSRRPPPVRESTSDSVTERAQSPVSGGTSSSTLTLGMYSMQDVTEEDGFREPDSATTSAEDSDPWADEAFMSHGEMFGRVPSLSNSVATLNSVSNGHAENEAFLASLMNPSYGMQSSETNNPTYIGQLSSSPSLTAPISNANDFSFLAGIDPAALSSQHIPANAQPLPTLDSSGFDAHDLLQLLPTAPASSDFQTNNLNVSFPPHASFDFSTDYTLNMQSPSQNTCNNGADSISFLQNILVQQQPQQHHHHSQSHHLQQPQMTQNQWSDMGMMMPPSSQQIQPLRSSHTGTTVSSNSSHSSGQYNFNVGMNDAHMSMNHQSMPMNSMSQPGPSRNLTATRSLPAMGFRARSSRSPPASSSPSSSSNIRPTAAGAVRRKTPVAIAPGPPINSSSSTSNIAATAIAKRPMKAIPARPTAKAPIASAPRPIMAAPSHSMKVLMPSTSMKRTAMEAAFSDGPAGPHRRLR